MTEIQEEDDKFLSKEIKIPENNEKKGLWRNLTAFWILGLCNNFGYVVMLTAAHDIIHDLSAGENGPQTDPDFKRECNKLSAGVILLADIFPALCVKLVAPFLPFYIYFQMTICVLLSVGSFILVAYAEAVWIAIIGVILTSISAGLGEVTLLSYTSRFNKNSVSTWSSGTGGAGIFGSLSYSAMTQAGLSTKSTLLIMTFVPILEAVVFIFLLEHPKNAENCEKIPLQKSKNDPDSKETEAEKNLVTFFDKLRYIPSLFKYIIPLLLGNICDNLINQAFSELIYFNNIFLDQKAQYRWYQVTYQIGVFISRSSVNVFKVRLLWLMAVLQGINVVLFSLEAVFWFIPSIWIVFAFILWEGLLGGSAYVNTFYRISEEIPPANRVFAISITAFSKTAGIALAGWLAMPTHNAICKVPTPNRLN
ncbi:battenin-like [Culicoides brevitarsis]|uniref:battenin-like n=1 Tax=Culicoides brevitarsis TaxID=469753 RepID=UPI00307B7EE6